MNITVIRCLGFLPSLGHFPFSIKPFSAKALKNNWSLSKFNMFRGSWSWHSSDKLFNPSLYCCCGNLIGFSIQYFSQSPYICFHFSSHLFETLRWVNSSFFQSFRNLHSFILKKEPVRIQFALGHFP